MSFIVTVQRGSATQCESNSQQQLTMRRSNGIGIYSDKSLDSQAVRDGF